MLPEVAVPWYRAHRSRPGHGGGCWWFASWPAAGEPAGRFDLIAPLGTCYLSDSAETAARERLGRYLARREWVPFDQLEGHVVSRVATLHTRGRPVADSTAPRASDTFGVTRELSTLGDYRLTSRWAAALQAAGFAALAYQPRFSTGDQLCVALFGDEGGRTWAVRSSQSLQEVASAMGVRIAPRPHDVATDSTSEPDTP